jgi:hypothetical protein
MNFEKFLKIVKKVALLSEGGFFDRLYALPQRQCIDFI